MNAAELRKEAHLKAQAHFLKEDYSAALKDLNEAREKWGDHVGLLSDLASTYYRLNDFGRWNQTVNELQSAVALSSKNLSQESRQRTRYLLAKFFEEKAELSTALKFYREGLNEAQTHNDQEWERNYLCQILRLKSIFRITQGLGKNYTSLLLILKEDLGYERYIECKHALLLADAELVGQKVAFSRWQEFKKIPELIDYDYRLALFDLLEIYLVRGWTPTELLSDLEKCSSGDLSPFEEELKRFAVSSSYVPSPERLLEISTLLPLASYLRILFLSEARAQETSEIRRQILLVLDALDPEAVKLWQLRKLESSSRGVVLEIDMKTFQITRGLNGLSLKKTPLMAQILILLSTEQTLSFQKLCRKLWQAEYNESYFHRIRMMLLRMNRKLAPFAGLPQVVELRQENIHLSAYVSLKIKDVQKCS